MVSLLRKFAQAVRHAPVLRLLTPVFSILRKPYLRTLTALSRHQGIPINVGGYPIRLNADFATLSWETIEFASYRAFATEIKPGNVVYDVGAHIGTYTVIALQRSGVQGTVVAYEPHECTRNYLTQHINWNGCEGRVIIRDVCCGATRGTSDFYCVPNEPEGMNSLVVVEGFEKRVVRVTTLDAEVDELGLIPSIIKVDVEGAEWDVLKGAEAVLQRYKPKLFLSLHPPALAKLAVRPETVLSWLIERGYTYEVIAYDHEVHVLARADQNLS